MRGRDHPVIGIILMVAVTVVLATVVGIYAFGMADPLPHTPIVGAAVTRDDGAGLVRVTYQGTGDSGAVQSLGISNGVQSVVITAPRVGEAAGFPAVTGTRYRIVVSASFSDGTIRIVFDTVI